MTTSEVIPCQCKELREKIAAEDILISKHQRYRQMLRDILADEVRSGYKYFEKIQKFILFFFKAINLLRCQ